MVVMYQAVCGLEPLRYSFLVGALLIEGRKVGSIPTSGISVLVTVDLQLTAVCDKNASPYHGFRVTSKSVGRNCDR